MNKKSTFTKPVQKISFLNSLKKVFTRIDRQVFLLVGVIIALLLFMAVTGTRDFFTPRSFKSMAVQMPELGILALGMMITILIGGINLSINSIANLTSILIGFLLLNAVPKGTTPDQMTIYLIIAALLTFVIGMVCGSLNGYLIGYLGVPPILATLGDSLFFIGIGLGLTNGKTLFNFPEQITAIGSGNFLEIPIPMIIFILLAIVLYIVLNFTTFGFKARMMGANPTASNFSGIDNKKVIMTTHIISGVLGAITGILIMARTNSAYFDYGKTYVLLTILISVLGGVVSGFGNVTGVVLAVIILQMLGTGFHMFFSGLQGNAFFVDFIWGVLLIVIFIINYFIRLRRERT